MLQLKEEEERKRRSNNIIIHGIMESDFCYEENQNFATKKAVNMILKEIKVDGIGIKTIERIGVRTPDKGRPIIVKLDKEADKQLIFKQLKNLKGKKRYLGISITEDYTIKERKILNDWRQKMKDKNNKETGGYCWCLRGSPRTTLRLVKVDKQKDQDNNTNFIVNKIGS